MKTINVVEIYPYGVPRSYISNDGELIVEMEAYIDGTENPVLVRINLGDDVADWETLVRAVKNPQVLVKKG